MATLRIFLLLLAGFVVNAPAHAQCRDPGAQATIPVFTFAEFAQGFKDPVHIAHAGDGSGRLFVVEQAGTIRVIENGKVLAEPFLDLRDRVESGGEMGLLSVAFHPDYKTNGLLFIDYTTRPDRLYTHVSRLRARGNRADPRSEEVLLRIEQPYTNHNGGQLAFGPDRHLYIGMGDGGSANDPQGNGQKLSTLLGKILRIDVNARTPGRAYAIPADNPFAKRSDVRAEIWAFGLRNPWRFSFDSARGTLFAADVGQNRLEEIDVIVKGGNYGWNIMEGDICTPSVNLRCDKSGLQPPILVYPHAVGQSVTGGFAYRGDALPELCGVYVYADYVSGRIFGLRYDGERVSRQREIVKSRHAISSFGVDEKNELYAADHRSGKILKAVRGSKNAAQ